MARKFLYILASDNETPIAVDDAAAWSQWLGETERHVDETVFDLGDDEQIVVSTVFLGIDSGFILRRDRPPLLWESMIFGSPFDREQQRYSSAREARAGHNALVERVHQLVLLRQQAAER